MKYRVTFETDVRPTHLPEGGVIEELSSLPMILDTGVERRITVEQDMLLIRNTGDTPLYGSQIGAYLKNEQMVKIADALYEAAGRKPVEAEDPPVVIDDDGDRWYLRKNGLYNTVLAVGTLSLDQLKRDYPNLAIPLNN